MSLPYSEQPALVEPKIFAYCCRVTNALKVVAVIEMVWLCLDIGACVYGVLLSYVISRNISVFSLNFGRYSSIVGLIFAILGLVSVGKLFLAVQHVLPKSVNLYLGWKNTQMVFALIAVCFVIYALTETKEYVSLRYLLICFLVYIVVLLVSGAIFLAIAHKAKEYLTQKIVAMANEAVILTPMPATIQGQAPPSYVPGTIQGQAPPSYVLGTIQGQAPPSLVPGTIQGQAPPSYFPGTIQGQAPPSYVPRTIQGQALPPYVHGTIQGQAPSPYAHY